MTSIFRRLPTVATLVLGLSIVAATPAQAQSQVARKEGTWVVRDFRFHTGEVLPELRLHYATMGEPGGEPVLVLHGTTGSGTAMTGPAFGGELFGPGQPLDAARYFIILPDAIGTGKSSKPSDGLRARFPKYNYDDMVDAQYRSSGASCGLRSATRRNWASDHLAVLADQELGEVPLDGQELAAQQAGRLGGEPLVQRAGGWRRSRRSWPSSESSRRS
jgi:hypothetical protein